jgi:flavin reductase (DIM6/NTAB) family NADH-FMN oxidoreductase RutF
MKESKIGGSAQGGAREVEDTARGAFVDALARWASGVAVLAVREEGRAFGITVTAFSSVSLDPPLVLVCLGRNAIVLPTLLSGAAEFVVNILAEDQRRLASIFTDVGPLGRDAFQAEGAPVLPDSLASLVCSVESMHEAGDHWIVVGRVRDTLLGRHRAPLLRFERAWRAMAASQERG